MSLRVVDVVVSNKLTGESYEAKSYPNWDHDGDGRYEFYKTPIYYVYIDGTNAAGTRERRIWKAPRFMPYWNDPKAPDPHYKTLGFVNSGLTYVARKAVRLYKADYEVHNTYSEFGGAIQIQGSFLIHAGPEDLTASGWGAAGCVEIVGNFEDFKADILDLAGWKGTSHDKGLEEMVAHGKLFVSVERAKAPVLKNAVTRQMLWVEQDGGGFFVDP
jgi:hypothetical protein